MLGSEAEILTIEILEKIPKNFFVFRPCRASACKPPSARENNISPSLPLGSVGVASLITSAYTYRERVVTPTDPKGKEGEILSHHVTLSVCTCMYFPLHNLGVSRQISDFLVLKITQKYAVGPEQK